MITASLTQLALVGFAALAIAIIGALNVAASSYGRTVTETIGRRISCIASSGAEYKVGGVTIDWTTVTAVSSDTTLADGTVVKNGDKYLRYGQPIDLIGTAEVQTIDLSPGADPTGGTWTLTFSGTCGNGTVWNTTLTGLAYNITAAALRDAIIAGVPGIYAGDITVALATFVYTLTFSARFGNVPALTSDGSGMTTATAINHATSTAGVGTGLYGPVDTSASDGRQTMARGETFILPETVLMSELGSSHAGVIDGGPVFRQRLIIDSTNAATKANLLTAMPRLVLVEESA